MVALHTSGQIAPVAVSSVFIVVIAVSVALRIYARRLKKLSLGIDDYLVLAAAVFTYGLITCDIVGVVHGGVGRHVSDVVAAEGPGVVVIFLKDLVAVQMLWSTSLMFVKLSILFFYLEIFGAHPKFRMVAHFVMGIVVLWCLSVILCGFFLCRPFAYNWDQSIKGSCGDQVKSYIVTGALNICTDVMVLGLPLPIVWNLHAPLANRLALIGIFAIGFFVCVISILRMRALLSVDYSDITYSVIDALIWSMLEPALGIALACAPIMRPIFRIFRDKSSKSGSSGPTSIDVLASPKGDSRNFQRLEEETGYQLGLMSHNHSYVTKLGVSADDVESQKSSRSESELVPTSIVKIKVKTDWKVTEEERAK